MNDDLTKLCNHKRKLLAMASFHTSQMSNATTPAPTSCSANMFHNNAATELAMLDENIPEPKPAIPPTKGTVNKKAFQSKTNSPPADI